MTEDTATAEMPRVQDQQGHVRSWDWLVATLGPLHLDRATPTGPGQPVFRLDEVRVAEGPAILVVRVTDTRRLPLAGVLVVRSWEGAPGLPSWPPPASRWRDRGVVGATGREGAVGFGLSAADAYELPGIGPASVWVADPAGPSDRLDGLGLLASAGRVHLDLGFCVVQEMPAVLSKAGDDLALAPAAPVVAEPPAPPSPPPAPLPLAADQWALLLDRLDRVVQALEEQAVE